MRLAIIAATALLAPSMARAQVTTGYIMVIVSGHAGDFHDTMHTMPSLDECEADAERAARSAKGRGEILGGVSVSRSSRAMARLLFSTRLATPDLAQIGLSHTLCDQPHPRPPSGNLPAKTKSWL
jgi:hypothetical protein